MSVGRDPRRRLARRLCRALAPVAVLAALLLLGAGPAAAHADLERSDPPNGGMLAPGRTTLTLWFGEPIAPAAATFTVRRSDGVGGAAATTASTEPGGEVVHLSVPPLETGTYTLTWAVTAVDGHPTRGTVLFGVGFRPDGIASAATPGPDVEVLLVRLADLGGVLLALGSLVVAARLLGGLGDAAPWVRRRALTAGALGGTVALAAATATPVVGSAAQLGAGATPDAIAGSVRDLVLTSTWGSVWVVRVVALVVAYVALWWARRVAAEAVRRFGAGEGRWRGPGRVAAAALAVAVVLDAWTGHASALPARSALTAVVAALHVLAASVWAGGLVVLLVGIGPVVRLDRRHRAWTTGAVWRAFSPLAAVSSAVLVATGLYEAARHVEPVGTMTRSVYGQGVLAKLVLLAVALALAGYNTLVVHRRLAGRVGALVGLGSAWAPRSRSLVVTATVEAAVLLSAVGVAALLTSTPTAREVTAAAVVTVPHSDSVDGLFVTAEVVPTGSRQRVVVRTEAVQRPMPWPVTGADVALRDGTTLTPDPHATGVRLEAVDEGRYEAAVADPGTPVWTAQVSVHRAGRPDVVLLLPGSSATRTAPSVLELAAGGVALLVLTGTALAVGIRRRGPRPEKQPRAIPAHGSGVPEEVHR